MSFTPLDNSVHAVADFEKVTNESFRTARNLGVAAKTAAFTAWTDDAAGAPVDVYLVDATAAAVTVTLPAAASADAADGRPVTILKTDAGANAVTLDPNASETINGATTLALASQYDRAIVVSDGSNWWRIG